MKIYIFATGLCLCTLFTACTVLPSAEQSLEAFVSQQKAGARLAQDEQRLAESLTLWQSLLPLDADDTEVNAAIISLQRQIDSQSRQLLHRADAAYAQGRRREGDLLMLKVLVLQPGQKRALVELRKSESTRAQAQQTGKSEQENQARVSRQSNAPESIEGQLRSLYVAGDYAGLLATSAALPGEPNVETARLIRSSHEAIASQAAQRGERDTELNHLILAMAAYPAAPELLLDRTVELREELSEDWYRRGNGLMKGDLSGAIAALEKSVDYNPENRAARLKLKQARILQRNLLKIQSGSGS